MISFFDAMNMLTSGQRRIITHTSYKKDAWKNVDMEISECFFVCTANKNSSNYGFSRLVYIGPITTKQ